MELGIPGSGNGYGSGLGSEGLKREGSGFFGNDDAWRALKMAKTDADAHMLRFSPGSQLEFSALPDFHHMEAAQYKNSGYYSSGGLDTSTGVYLLNGVRGPFTPSQWIELEQQALIYRYITANQPIPLHLLIPIRKAFESAAGFYGFNGSTLKPAAWGWSPFHLGYSNSSDPEPGRCRRTDGKKWRCSRDAVTNQKYCDKHMNRGRHRSRKHVEGQGTKSSTTKPITPNGGSSSINININQHQNYQGKSLQPTTSNTNTNTSLNRMMQDATQLSFLSQSISLNCNEHQICSHLLDSTSQNTLRQTESREPVSTFSENWPKSNQCSAADFMSSTSSPINEKSANVSPLRLSQEYDWKPVLWEAPMGGPLAEALQSNGRCQLSSASPTGVLQSSFVSLSNSSAGSSPRADISKTIESAGSLCTDVFGSAPQTCSPSLHQL